jgi:integrase
MIDFRSLARSMPRERYSRPTPFKSKTKPAKWMGEWYVYRFVNGKEKRVHRGPKVLGLCSHMTKTEAQQALDAIVTEERSSSDQKPDGEPTFAWILKAYIELKSPGWSDAHRETMVWLAKKYLTPAFGASLLRSLTKVGIQTYLNQLAASGASYSLVYKIRTYVKAVLEEALDQDLIDKNPARARRIEIPRTKEKCTRFLTEDECTKLLAACSGRDHLIVSMCMVQGLRPSEVFALKRDDIEAGRIRIDDSAREGKLQGRTKTRDSNGYVTLPLSLGIELRHWLENSPCDPAGLVFPSEKPGVPMRQKNFLRRNMKAAAERAGLEGVNFQSLRRTTATHIGAVGTVKDAQAMLRHSTPNLTAGTYMQAIDSSVVRAAEELDKRLRKETVQ